MRRGKSLATAIGGTVFVAIALLIVTVGVLATESRLPRTARDTASWHTSKVSRMEKCGGEELAPVQLDVSRATTPVIATEVIHYYRFSRIESPLPELVGVPQAHGLRAPPRV
jgi:hypothetical protein